MVPTANVASMEFLPNCRCSDGADKADEQEATQTSGDGESQDRETQRLGKPKKQDCNCREKYVRTTIRQDAGTESPANLPACLVYVGATETAQFLVEIMGDKASDSCRQLEPGNDKRSEDTDQNIEADSTIGTGASPGPKGSSPRTDCEECCPAENCAPCKGEKGDKGDKGEKGKG